MTCNLTEIELKYLVTKVTNKSDLAAKVGTSISTVDKYLKKYGINVSHFVKRDKGKPKNACNKKLKPKDIDQIKILIKQGVTQKHIAKMFNIAQCTVSHIKRNNKCYYRHTNDVSKSKRTDERNDKIVKLYESGLDQYMIGDLYKIKQSTVCRILLAKGVKTRPPFYTKMLTQEKIDEIMALKKQGLNTNQIAKMAKVHFSTAAKYSKKAKRK